MHYTHLYSRGVIIHQALAAGAIVALLSLMGVILVPDRRESLADMTIDPPLGLYEVGEEFKIHVMVRADVPTNVFKGEVLFDPTKLQIRGIDYNTSIADLWAERPWYENGEGTLNFIGGTTVRGGFVGTGPLISVTFRTLSTGDASVKIHDARILAHDGLGTDVTLREPIDALFEVSEEKIAAETIAQPIAKPSQISVIDVKRTDLNGDGVQSILDMSIFMSNLMGEDARYDFNNDGTVDTKDLSILMGAE